MARTKKINQSYKQIKIGNRLEREHRLLARRSLGRDLPHGVEVHHVNYDKTDNWSPFNLVICTREYHALIHQRTDAFNACGHASWRKCNICHQYDDPGNMSEKPHRKSFAYFHIKCAREYRRKRRTQLGLLTRPELWT